LCNNDLISVKRDREMKSYKSIFLTIMAVTFIGCGGTTNGPVDLNEDTKTELTGGTQIDVNENSTNIITISANVGAVLKLSGEDADKFEFKDFVLAFKDAPDYEEDKHNYYVTVEIYENGGLKKQDYHIVLQNVNDNIPEFTAYEVLSIPENVKKVQLLTARDLDDDNVTFALDMTRSNDTELFEIEDNLLRFKEEPNYEKQSSYVCSIILSDGFHEIKRDITITIENIPDGVAVLEPLDMNVSESANKGTKVGQINILTSGDSDISVFEVEGDGNEDFYINKEGEIKVSLDSKLDYERQRSYQLRVSAVNKAGYSRPVDLNITVENEIDEVPVLEIFRTTIMENDHLGKYLGQVHVISEGDSSISDMYLSGDGSENFVLDQWGGLRISSSAELDYETKELYKLYAIAKNEAGESEPVRVDIYIEDYEPNPFEVAHLNDKDLEIGDEFGRSVAIDGSYIVVGAPYDDNEGGVDAGIAYLYRKYLDGSVKKIADLKADDGQEADLFGTSVAISDRYIVVGAYKEDESADAAGSAYVFKRDSDSKIEQIAKIQADDANKSDWFGFDVAIDGDYIVVGAYLDDYDNDNNDTGAAYLFKIDDDNVTQTAKITASDLETNSTFGRAVAIDGKYIVVGAKDQDKDDDHEDQGAAYLYEIRDDDSVKEIKKIVSQADDGDENGANYDHFGNAVDIQRNDIVIGSYQRNNGDEDVGAIYWYKIDGDDVTKVKTIFVDSDDREKDDAFGSDVAISGNFIAGGSQYKTTSEYQAGAVYLFEMNSNRDDVDQIKEIIPFDSKENDLFGKHLALDGNNIVVGTHRRDVEATQTAGSAYLFDIEPKLRPYVYNLEQYYIEYKEEAAKKFIREFDVKSPVSDELSMDVISGDDESKLQTEDLKLYFSEVVDYENPVDEDEQNHYDFGIKFKDKEGNFYISYNSVAVEDREFLRVDEISAEDISSYDGFGSAVSIYNDYMAVGAPLKDIDDEDDAGAVYILHKTEDGLEQKARIIADDGEGGDQFGYSVSKYGVYIAVGAPFEDSQANDGGAVYIFKYDDGEYKQLHKLTPDTSKEDANFGASVWFEGDLLVVGAPGYDDKGAIYLFSKDDNDDFTQEDNVTGEDDNDLFGTSVCLDTQKIVVGAPGVDNDTGKGYVYHVEDNNTLEKIDDFSADDKKENDKFAKSVSIDDDYIVAGAKDADDKKGRVYLFKASDDSVTQKDKFQASNASDNSYFGSSVAIYEDTILVGAKGAKGIGYSYYYEKDDNDDVTEVERFKVRDPQDDDNLGASVALHHEYGAVGAPKRTLGAKHGGSALMFIKDSNQKE